MPHDRSGNELKAGDKVLFTAEVVEVFAGETACNANFRILDVDGKGEYTPNFSCNTRLADRIPPEVLTPEPGA